MIAPACRRCLGSHPAWSLSQCVSRGHHSSGGAATLIAVRHLPPPAQPGSPRTTKHQRFHRHSDRFVSLAPPGFCPYGIPQRRCQRGSVQLRFPEVLARQSSLLIASLRCSLDFCKPLLVSDRSDTSNAKHPPRGSGGHNWWSRASTVSCTVLATSGILTGGDCSIADRATRRASDRRGRCPPRG